jgi:carbonic anhydrase/acetyltransferase-like protein (isoleucine patch superfamily)
MLKIILQNRKDIQPFCEPARELRIQNTPLWLHQRNLLAPYVTRELELSEGEHLPPVNEPCIVYRDNLFFDEHYLQVFMQEALNSRKAVRAAFRADDPAFREHALPLSTSYTQADHFYLADLWYYPKGPVEEVEPLVVDLQAREIGYYRIPSYLAGQGGDLVYQVPLRALIAIDSWVHVFIADAVFGQFKRGARFEKRIKEDAGYKLKILAKAMYEGRQLLECSELVKIGRNCSIDPSATIHGPTVIGDNVTINAGVVIDNCLIGNNISIAQDAQLMLSVVGDGCFLPFRSALFMSTLMDNTTVAQNTCLQMSVIGRNTFIGSGSTWTDFNLLPKPIRARNGEGDLRPANRPAIGGCVGHHCRIGSGLIIYPARMIESDVLLTPAWSGLKAIDHDIHFEESDHHRLKDANLHQTPYHRNAITEQESW